jgi:DNA integrity scanning protein DisA with diadenylate cyclase activity
MSIVASILQILRTHLLIFSFYDVLEIATTASIVYCFVRWLSHDTQKNIVAWFYGYCLLLFGSYYIGLPTIHVTCCIAMPIVITLFIIMHEQTLQKNFITLTSLSPQINPTLHWLEILIQGCLQALNKNKEIFCVIERKDSLDLFLSSPAIFNADVTQEIVEILTKNEPTATLWITQAGKIHTCNPIWRTSADEIWVTNDVKALHVWKQNALLMTSKSDAIMFTISPTTRLCTIIMEGKIVNDLSAHHAFALLKNYCVFSKPGDINAPVNKNSHIKQTITEN